MSWAMLLFYIPKKGGFPDSHYSKLLLFRSNSRYLTGNAQKRSTLRFRPNKKLHKLLILLS